MIVVEYMHVLSLFQEQTGIFSGWQSKGTTDNIKLFSSKPVRKTPFDHSASKVTVQFEYCAKLHLSSQRAFGKIFNLLNKKLFILISLLSTCFLSISNSGLERYHPTNAARSHTVCLSR